MTILEVLTAATGYLRDHRVESPRLNAEHLLAHVLHKSRLDLYLEFDRVLSEAQRTLLRELIRERGAGRPLQHLLGTTEFFGRTFLSDSRALIPRPETEQLVELIVEDPRYRAKKISVLDVGTGSGVIAITLALELPFATVVATDVSPDALSLARENTGRHSLDQKIAFYAADLFPPTDERFDCIVANPPYIATTELTGLQPEVQHDPFTALDGGSDGLLLIGRLIKSAPEHLARQGLLAMEIGDDQLAKVVALLVASGYREITVHKDHQGVERFIIALVPG
jgi:release factor glutamine methyltransferase